MEAVRKIFGLIAMTYKTNSQASVTWT